MREIVTDKELHCKSVLKNKDEKERNEGKSNSDDLNESSLFGVCSRQVGRKEGWYVAILKVNHGFISCT